MIIYRYQIGLILPVINFIIQMLQFNEQNKKTINLQSKKRKHKCKENDLNVNLKTLESENPLPIKIFVTISKSNQMRSNRLKNSSIASNPQNSRNIQNIKVTEFKEQETQNNPKLFQRNVVQEINVNKNWQITNNQSTKTDVFHDLKPQQNVNIAHIQSQKWKQIDGQSQLRQALNAQLVKKQKQILFYQDLLEQKRNKYKIQQLEKRKQYEKYIQNLIKLYQKEVEIAQRNVQKVKQKECNSIYRRRRQYINENGQKGLNFSPKEVSILSEMGIHVMSTIKKSSQKIGFDQNLLFSFGSHNKQLRSKSASKQAKLIGTKIQFSSKE